MELESIHENQNDISIDYPSIILEGITSKEEVDYFREIITSSDNLLPLYCKIGSKYKKLGYININLDTFIMIRNISKEYKVYLAKSKDIISEIDLNKTETYLKLIKI